MSETTISQMLEKTQLASQGETLSGKGVDVDGLSASVGRFRLERRLGAGAMGVVYLARDPDLDRHVAVKIIGLEQVLDCSRREQLLREAKAMARVQHNNVVTVYEAGISDAYIWIAMEYIKGATLTQWLRSGPRSWRSVLDIMLAAGEGVAAVHSAGFVHRDIKPDNIMVAGDGRVKLMDFGLVREIETFPDTDGRRDADTASRPDERLIGTPRYMAPELYRAQTADAISDQYSWCVACWEAVYGRSPFPQSTLGELVQAIIEGKVSAPPLGREVPAWLGDVLLRGLNVDPSRRFVSMDGLFSAIAKKRSMFLAAVSGKNAAALRIEVWIGLFLVPLFWVLDWVVLKPWIWVALGMRLLCAASAGGVILFAVMAPRSFMRYESWLSFAYSQVVVCSIAMLCFLHGGYESPYYAGMCLLYMAVGQFFSWDIRRSLAFALVGYGFYMVPLAVGAIVISDGFVVLLNQFFLLSTILITVVSQVHRFRQARVDFEERIVQERLLAHARTPRSVVTARIILRKPLVRHGFGRHAWRHRGRNRHD